MQDGYFRDIWSARCDCRLSPRRTTARREATPLPRSRKSTIWLVVTMSVCGLGPWGSDAAGADCKTLLDEAMDTPLTASFSRLGFSVHGVHVATREWPDAYTSFAMTRGFDLATSPVASSPAGQRDSFWLSGDFDLGGLLYVGEVTQVFPRRASTDRSFLELRRGGRLTIRSITWGFVLPLENLSCERGTLGRVIVSSRNVVPGWGIEAYTFVVTPVPHPPLN
jgi:hypothetical protein